MSIQPFQIAIPDAVLDDLARRLDATIWPHTLEDAGWDYGTDLQTLRDLVDHWRHRFDWRAREAELNRFPQFQVQLGDCLGPLHLGPGRRGGRSRSCPSS